MKVAWTVTSEIAELKLEPETNMDRAFIEGMRNVDAARVKANGSLLFIIDVPKTPIVKPIQPRPTDDVRDTK